MHVGLADTEALRNFVLDRLTVRAEIGHVETCLIFDQTVDRSLEPLYD